MATQAELDKKNRLLRERNAEIRELREELEATNGNPNGGKLTASRFLGQFGREAMGNTGAVAAGLMHDRNIGPIKGKSVVSVVGGITQIASLFMSPVGWSSVVMAFPNDALKGNIAIRTREAALK